MQLGNHMVSTVPRQGLIYFHPFRLDSVSITRELSQIDIASTTLSQIHMVSTYYPKPLWPQPHCPVPTWPQQPQCPKSTWPQPYCPKSTRPQPHCPKSTWPQPHCPKSTWTKPHCPKPTWHQALRSLSVTLAGLAVYLWGPVIFYKITTGLASSHFLANP